MPGPTVRSFHENLAGTVDDDFGEGVVRQVWRQRLKVARQHQAAAIALDRCDRRSFRHHSRPNNGSGHGAVENLGAGFDPLS